jgi:GNAT superfamily N-acetyltransferase
MGGHDKLDQLQQGEARTSRKLTSMARPTAREDEVELAGAHRELVAASLLEPLDLGGADEQTWADCDLASLAENRLGVAVDPRGLTSAQRQDLLARATVEPCSLPSQRRFEACFWLLEAGERIGTVALESSLLGTRRLRLSSLYVFLDRRGHGVGARALRRLREGLATHRLGIRLETSWCWQAAVRFYLREGFWLHGWKRELSFSWEPNDPPARFSLSGDGASLSIGAGAGQIVLAPAERAADRLVLQDEAADGVDAHFRELQWRAPSTLALWLALHGWPLVRSSEAWRNPRHSDFGAPEALAYKIVVWEAWDRKHGFQVETPRIPGLRYLTWDELDTEWTALRE